MFLQNTCSYCGAVWPHNSAKCSCRTLVATVVPCALCSVTFAFHSFSVNDILLRTTSHNNNNNNNNNNITSFFGVYNDLMMAHNLCRNMLRNAVDGSNLYVLEG
jgi:hypothetical protein